MQSQPHLMSTKTAEDDEIQDMINHLLNDAEEVINDDELTAFLDEDKCPTFLRFQAI